MFVSITILLIIAYTLKSREKYTELPPGPWKNTCENNFNTDQWGNLYIMCEVGTNPPTSIAAYFYPTNPPCNNYENIGGNLICVPK